MARSCVTLIGVYVKEYVNALDLFSATFTLPVILPMEATKPQPLDTTEDPTSRKGHIPNLIRVSDPTTKNPTPLKIAVTTEQKQTYDWKSNSEFQPVEKQMFKSFVERSNTWFLWMTYICFLLSFSICAFGVAYGLTKESNLLYPLVGLGSSTVTWGVFLLFIRKRRNEEFQFLFEFVKNSLRKEMTVRKSLSSDSNPSQISCPEMGGETGAASPKTPESEKNM